MLEAPPLTITPRHIASITDHRPPTTDLHPLLTAAVVHYEIEFIHPFSDGICRIGRLCGKHLLFQA